MSLAHRFSEYGWQYVLLTLVALNSNTSNAQDDMDIVTIDDFASSNTEPHRPNERSPGLWDLQFPEVYDFQEQRRVFQCIMEFSENVTDAVWEALIEHSDDTRYSLTTVQGDHRPSAKNWTVGNVCESIAVHCLGISIRRAERMSSVTAIVTQDLITRDNIFEVPVVKYWRRARPNKTLRELQIELCQRAIAQVQRELDENDAKTLTACLKKEIEYLQHSSAAAAEPFHFRSQPYLYQQAFPTEKPRGRSKKSPMEGPDNGDGS